MGYVVAAKEGEGIAAWIERMSAAPTQLVEAHRKKELGAVGLTCGKEGDGRAWCCQSLFG